MPKNPNFSFHPGLIKPKSNSMYVSEMVQKLIKIAPAAKNGRIGYEGVDANAIEVNVDTFKKRMLLSPGWSNAKTDKNWRRSYIMYLVPAAGSGTNMCSHATPGCIFGCLFSAGRGAFNNVKIARLRRTKFYLQFEDLFYEMLTRDLISVLKSKPRKRVYKIPNEVAVRLNGTSDMPFVLWLNKRGMLDRIAEAVPDARKKLIFYDYTKNPKLAGAKVINGFRYYVTFSHAENYRDEETGKWVDNATRTLAALNSGQCVAAMFKALPEYWHDHKVLEGDDRDDLMIDAYQEIRGNQGVVLGLKPKGRGALEGTGDFLIECTDMVNCYSWGRIKK
jgi:hypothetical protein